MKTHSDAFQFPHQSWRQPQGSLRGFLQTGSVFQTISKHSCRHCSHRLLGVWVVPSTVPQISADTEESCFGTELSLYHSLKPKACGSWEKKRKKNRKGEKLNFTIYIVFKIWWIDKIRGSDSPDFCHLSHDTHSCDILLWSLSLAVCWQCPWHSAKCFETAHLGSHSELLPEKNIGIKMNHHTSRNEIHVNIKKKKEKKTQMSL